MRTVENKSLMQQKFKQALLLLIEINEELSQYISEEHFESICSYKHEICTVKACPGRQVGKSRTVLEITTEMDLIVCETIRHFDNYRGSKAKIISVEQLRKSKSLGKYERIYIEEASYRRGKTLDLIYEKTALNGINQTYILIG